MYRKFENSDVLMEFAQRFVNSHVGRAKKDIRILLRKDDETRKYGYFPALLTSLTLLEFLSGLYAGRSGIDNEKGIKLKHWNLYAKRFLNRDHYSYDNLKILRDVFRHKIAHLGHPHYVTEVKLGEGTSLERLVKATWYVSTNKWNQPIKILETGGNASLSGAGVPWLVPFNLYVKVSIPKLRDDFVESSGKYLELLQSNSERQAKFENCMNEFFPPE